jgi:hypothetical protein
MTRGFKDLEKKLESIKIMKKSMADTAHGNAKKIARRSGRYLMMEDAVATGKLLTSFYLDRDPTRVEVGNDADYAKYVEYGTGTQFGSSEWPVPTGISKYKSADFSSELIVEIMQWARVKPSVQVHGNLRAFATTVAKNIDENGTPPQPFWRPAVSRGLISLIMDVRNDFRSELKARFGGS